MFDTLIDFYEHLKLSLTSFSTELRQLRYPDQRLFEELAHDELERFFARQPEFLPGVIADLSRPALYKVAEHFSLPLKELLAHDGYRSGTLADFVAVLRKQKDSATDNAVRTALVSILESGPQQRSTFAKWVLDPERLREGLKKRLERAAILLRAERPEVYEEYDRLRAEGAFRSGVSVPTATLLVSIGYWVIIGLSPPTSNLPARFAGLAAGGLVVMLMLDFSGERKTSEATWTLYSSIRHELVSAQREQQYGLEVALRKEIAQIADKLDLASNWREALREIRQNSVSVVTAPLRRRIHRQTVDEGDGTLVAEPEGAAE
jgi:hypothetical protein